MQNILLVGASGLLGSEFVQIFREKDTDFLAPNRMELEIADRKSVELFFEHHEIDLVICAAGYTAVDLAEKERWRCQKANVWGVKNLLAMKKPLIHFSTDYVFDGLTREPIAENAKRNPLNFYGKSKMEAEMLLEKSDAPWWNIRTSWLFGKNGRSFITTILGASEGVDFLPIVCDQTGIPTSAKDLAETVVKNFLEKNPPFSGHYHIVNSGKTTTWADFAKFIFAEKNIKTVIRPIKTSELNRPAARPTYSVLANTKLDIEMPNWKTAVKKFLSASYKTESVNWG